MRSTDLLTYIYDKAILNLQLGREKVVALYNSESF